MRSEPNGERLGRESSLPPGDWLDTRPNKHDSRASELQEPPHRYSLPKSSILARTNDCKAKSAGVHLGLASLKLPIVLAFAPPTLILPP